LENLHYGRGEAGHFGSVFAAELLHEVLRKQREILYPLPQRKDRHRNDVQPVKEILAEFTSGYQIFEILVGCGDEAEVAFD